MYAQTSTCSQEGAVSGEFLGFFLSTSRCSPCKSVTHISVQFNLLRFKHTGGGGGGGGGGHIKMDTRGMWNDAH